MALYKGFSTKKFNYSNPTTITGLQDNDVGPYTLTDKNLIIMDLLNHFNTRKGERLMNPNFGCLIWDRLFDPMTQAIKDAIVNDVSSIIKSDPRISVLSKVTIQESADNMGLLISAEIIIKNTNELVALNVAFDGTTGVANASINY
jgi:phage baseplate assembly protein W